MKHLELIFSGDIAHATWHTDHALDAERWFRFVDQYAIDHRFHVDESDLIQEIASMFGRIGQYDAVWRGFQIHVSELVSVVVKTQYYGDSRSDLLLFFNGL